MLSRFVIKCVECVECVGVLVRFFAVWSLVVSVCGSGIPFVACDCANAEVMDRCTHMK